MTRFTGLPDQFFRNEVDLPWEVGRKGSGALVVVPAGFIFDVSVPPGARWIFDPGDPAYLKASCVHDWLLVDGWDRITAGAVFHEILRTQDISVFRRLVMWLAVSLWRYR